jgi:transposase
VVRRRSRLRPTLIVLEATGGLALHVASELATAALPVAVVHPRQGRHVAKATGQLAKTDARDAAVLAQLRTQSVRWPGHCRMRPHKGWDALVTRRR